MSNTYQNPLDVATLSSSPSAPGSGFIRIYTKTDGKTYTKDASGTEIELSIDPRGRLMLYTLPQYSDISNESVSGSVSWDLQAKQSRKLTMSANITMSNPTNKDLVQTGLIIIVQPSSGGPYTVTWDTDFTGMNGDAIPDVQTAADSVTIIFYVCDGTYVYLR